MQNHKEHYASLVLLKECMVKLKNNLESRDDIRMYKII